MGKRIRFKRIVRPALPILVLFLSAACAWKGGALPDAAQVPGETVQEAESRPEGREGVDREDVDREGGARQATEDGDARQAKGDISRPQERDGGRASANMLPCGLPSAFDPASLPDFGGPAWTDVNDDVPFFTEQEMADAEQMAAAAGAGTGREGGFQSYGALDPLGRCTGACALVGPETLPQEERGNISGVKPAGWHTVTYENIEGGYLYNRCHLIGFQLTGQNSNEENLITGTRFMNIEGMLPYEDSVLAYVRGTGKHVLYRVSPVFEGDNLLASGVLMEACSVEDPLVRFCAFCFNVQPGIRIDYATGESREAGEGDSAENVRAADAAAEKSGEAGRKWNFIVNVSSGIFHRPDCDSVAKMREKNKQGFQGSREELMEAGYRPCHNCRP